MRTEVRNPLSLRIEVAEPETTSPYSAFEMVTARWTKHQGPGEVVFQHMDDASSMPRGTGLTTTATFSEPGNYVLRVQAYEGRAGWRNHCCWTNAYVEVTVTPDQGLTPTRCLLLCPTGRRVCGARPGAIAGRALAYAHLRPVGSRRGLRQTVPGGRLGQSKVCGDAEGAQDESEESE